MAKSTSTPCPSPCPCGGADFAQCCAPYLQGALAAPTAEKLMRSRYTAFTLQNEDYVRATWHASTRPQGRIFDQEEKQHWLGLEVKSDLRLRKRKEAAAIASSTMVAPQNAEGQQWDTVEFVARYKIAGRAYRLHEISRFVCEQGVDGPRWYYVDGSFPHER